MILHPYVPCLYDPTSYNARYCLCPDGSDRCHVKGCGRPREEHIGEGKSMIIEGDYTEKDWYGEVRVDGTILELEPSLKVYNHSPDGFSWGYAGSGPAQLALAILLRAGLSPHEAIHFHQDFKRQFIVPLPRGAFKITIDVDLWIKK